MSSRPPWFLASTGGIPVTSVRVPSLLRRSSCPPRWVTSSLPLGRKATAHPVLMLSATVTTSKLTLSFRSGASVCPANAGRWSYVAPFSWLVRSDVEDGRDELNFSTWDRDDGEADDAVEQILEGGMPPSQYTLIHRGARLTDEEADKLVAALDAMDDRD